MKRIYIKTIILFGLGMIILGCTQDFEYYNTNPYGLTEKSLEQDFNDIGAFIPSVTRMIVNTTNYRYQIAQNLCSDSWACYLAPPTPFASGNNNTTYKMTWKDHAWNSSYDGIMSPSKSIIQTAEKKNRPQFVAWLKIIKVYAMQRVASLHGPIIYSDYGNSPTYAKYDSEEELYHNFFKELDEAINILDNYKDFVGFRKFDVTTYKGDVKQWIKLANTVRLQLALRISKVKPMLAQKEAEKAWANPYGLILSNNDNFNIGLGNDVHPLATISYGWSDTMMSAEMESFLVGYKDARIGKMFAPIDKKWVTKLVPNHPDFPYKGIKNGAKLIAKDDRISYSKVGQFFKETTYHTVLNASEVSFMLAECQLRGWNVGDKSAKEYYEEGVRLSFSQWGATGVDSYLQDNVSTPIDYTDPMAAPGVNAFKAKTDITVAWNDTDSNEKKLERIITQKWIAGFPDSYVAWVDFRRTGYPKLSPVYQNDSEPSNGEIPANEFIKRMQFVNSEYENNSKAVEEAIQTLNGPDKISTRLWWDTNTSNF